MLAGDAWSVKVERYLCNNSYEYNIIHCTCIVGVAMRVNYYRKVALQGSSRDGHLRT